MNYRKEFRRHILINKLKREANLLKTVVLKKGGRCCIQEDIEQRLKTLWGVTVEGEVQWSSNG